MKYFNSIAISLLFVIMFISCNTEERKKEKLCMEYYDQMKDSVTARQTTINTILSSLHEIKEANDPDRLDTFMNEGDNSPIKLNEQSKLAPLNPKEVFMISMEDYNNKQDLNWMSGSPFDLPVYKKDIGDRIIKLGENIKSGNDDCYHGSSVNSLEEGIDDYLKIKYLIVSDCVFYKYPGITNGYEPGILIKKVDIINIYTSKVEDSFYIMAESSKSVTITNGDVYKMYENLADNYNAKLESAVFISYNSNGINHFNY